MIPSLEMSYMVLWKPASVFREGDSSTRGQTHQKWKTYFVYFGGSHDGFKRPLIAVDSFFHLKELLVTLAIAT